MSTPAAPAPPWVVIAGYPRWPSPYFAHLERYAPGGLRLCFRADLDPSGLPAGPGVINLHRLKRLYRDPGTGEAGMGAAERFLARLASLKENGWRLTWTVHNLLPIDGPPPGPADRAACDGVLALADAVLCHTRADACALARQTPARIWVTGWSALDPPAGPPSPEVAELAGQMRGWPAAFLLLGHLTAYKDAPAVITEFLASTRRARLAVAGDCADPGTARRLQRTASASAGRFILRLGKVPPEQAGHLYAAAHAAVCPYRSDGPFSFFTDVLYPGSVGTAAGFGVPVIAPALPAVAEITGGQPRWLASPGGGLGAAMAAAEADLLALTASADPRSTRPGPRSPDLWHRITSTYGQVSASLAQPAPGQPGTPGPSRR